MYPQVDDYLELLTSLYRTQPKFRAFCRSQIERFVEIQSVLFGLIDAFDLDKAIGKQLSSIGTWIGVERELPVLLKGVYFSWNIFDVGWNKGIWKSKYAPTTGIVSLTDDIFRSLLKSRIAENCWDGTISSAYSVWRTVFEEKMKIVIEDRQDMSVVIGIAGVHLDTITKVMLQKNYFFLKPSGVQVKYYAVSSNGGLLFCWGADSSSLGGWGKGAWSQNLALV